MCQQFVHFLRVGLIQSNLSSVLIVFCHFFTWSALGDVDLHFCPLLVTKANAVKQGTTSATLLCHQQSVHTCDWWNVVMSLFVSLQNRTSAARVHLCQITLNWKLLCKLEKCCKFSSHVKAKPRKIEIAFNKTCLYKVTGYFRSVCIFAVASKLVVCCGRITSCILCWSYKGQDQA
jgi:hypothetical protein